MSGNNIADLIPFGQAIVGEGLVQTVNARDLYVFLESKQEFASWIKNRIEKYGFAQGIDYTVNFYFINDETAFGGRRKVIDYHLTLDMAKELSMVERNEKGKQARHYFLECERIAKAAPVAMTPAELLLHQAQRLVDSERAIKKLEKKQIGLARRQTDVEQQQECIKANIKSILEGESFFSIKGYANLKKVKVDTRLASWLGKQASSLSRARGVMIGRVKDTQYGEVNTYHEDILQEVLERNHLVN